MRINLFIVASLCAAICSLSLAGCKKAKIPEGPDPQSVEAVMQRMLEQGELFNEALARQDYTYLHDYGYYFASLVQTLFTKLDDEQKKRLTGLVDQLLAFSKQLDRAAGGNRAEATAATVQRLLAALKEIDTQLREMKGKG